MAAEESTDLKKELTRREFVNQALIFVARTSGSWMLANLGLSVFFSKSVDEEVAKSGHFNEHTPIQILGKGFQMIGVTHNLPTFIEHQKRIEQIIQTSPFVLLEYFEKPEQKLGTAGLDTTTLRPKSLTDHASFFYAAVASVCAREGKDIITVNREGALSQEIEVFQLFGLAGGGSITAIEALIQKFKGEHITRRQFLTLTSILGFSALDWKSWGDYFKMMEEKTQEDTPQEKALLYGYNLLDWRDAATAQGVCKVIKRLGYEIDGLTSAPLFQGDGHSGMNFYIKNDRARKAKLALYPQFELTKKPIHRYR